MEPWPMGVASALIENHQAQSGLDDSLRENTFKRLLQALASL
jgi:hypothetical protein